MAIHYLSQRNLVTHKGTTWQFGLAADLVLPEESVELRWSWGTPFVEDTDLAPAIPTAWVDAGTGPVSAPITFALAAPAFVRVRILIDLALLESLGAETFFPDGEPVVDEETGRAVAERRIVVYPARMEVPEGPELLAQATRGYLPVLFHFLGLGPKVTVRDQLRYTIERPRPGTVSPRPFREDTDRFAHVPTGDIDRPARTRENGNGHTYNCYLAPRIIRRMGLAGETAAIAGEGFAVRITLSAHPSSEDRSRAVPLSERFRGIRYYIDERPYLLHFESETAAALTCSMAGDPSRVQPAKRFLRTLTEGGAVTSYPIRRRRTVNGIVQTVVTARPPSLRAADEDVVCEDRSSEAGGNVELEAEVVDTRGIWYNDHTHCRVEGARRGAATVVYYKLVEPYTSVLDGPRCLVGQNAPRTGEFDASVFADDPQAQIELAGLRDNAASVDYAAVLGSAFGLGATVSGVALAALTIKGIVVAPWVVVPLAVASAAAGAWWAFSPAATLPYTDGEVQIFSSAMQLGIDGRVKAAGANTIETRSVSRSQNTCSRDNTTRLDASFSVKSGATVGDEIRISQAYAVHVLQQEDESEITRAFVVKRDFDSALKMKAEA